MDCLLSNDGARLAARGTVRRNFNDESARHAASLAHVMLALQDCTELLRGVREDVRGNGRRPRIRDWLSSARAYARGWDNPLVRRRTFAPIGGRLGALRIRGTNGCLWDGRLARFDGALLEFLSASWPRVRGLAITVQQRRISAPPRRHLSSYSTRAGGQDALVPSMSSRGIRPERDRHSRRQIRGGALVWRLCLSLECVGWRASAEGVSEEAEATSLKTRFSRTQRSHLNRPGGAVRPTSLAR